VEAHSAKRLAIDATRRLRLGFEPYCAANAPMAAHAALRGRSSSAESLQPPSMAPLQRARAASATKSHGDAATLDDPRAAHRRRTRLHGHLHV
jgi:hypothetical protein